MRHHLLMRTVPRNRTSERLGSPTLVPFNTPTSTLTLSNSFPKFQKFGGSDLAFLLISFAFSKFSRRSESESSSFNLSFGSDDTSEDDGRLNLSTSLDTLLGIPPVALKGFSPSSLAPAVGLGISGVSRKEESGPFDGLGLLSIRPSHYRHSTPARNRPDHYGAYGFDSGHSLAPNDSTDSLSDIFLQEMLFTFTEDPHHTSLVKSIPECKSWYELDSLPTHSLFAYLVSKIKVPDAS